jgi:predicted RNase H-like HicB family nuclease
MQYTAFLTKEGKQTLAEFPGCPGCQTFADPGEDIAERAEEALAGWLEAHLARRAGLSQPAVARLEDPAHNPTLDTLERVAAALGTRLEVGLKAA